MANGNRIKDLSFPAGRYDKKEADWLVNTAFEEVWNEQAWTQSSPYFKDGEERLVKKYNPAMEDDPNTQMDYWVNETKRFDPDSPSNRNKPLGTGDALFNMVRKLHLGAYEGRTSGKHYKKAKNLYSNVISGRIDIGEANSQIEKFISKQEEDEVRYQNAYGKDWKHAMKFRKLEKGIENKIINRIKDENIWKKGDSHSKISGE